eukprot:3732762-Alexandrium_andersonii.AAC.1
MSASLVGSEMCIRDRARSSRSCGLRSTTACVRRRSPRSASAGRVGGSVSYTHLTLPTICSV